MVHIGRGKYMSNAFQFLLYSIQNQYHVLTMIYLTFNKTPEIFLLIFQLILQCLIIMFDNNNTKFYFEKHFSTLL